MLRAADRRRPQNRGSLATLLHESAHELLGVGFENTIDLVQHAVYVVVERVLAGGRLRGGLGGLGRILRGVVTTLRSAVLLAGHLVPPQALIGAGTRLNESETPDNLRLLQPNPLSTAGGGQFP